MRCWSSLVAIARNQRNYHCASRAQRSHWWAEKNQNLVKGVIQQLSGSNFTQFWSPTPLELTKIDIIHTIYPWSRDPVDFLLFLSTYLLNDPLSLDFHNTTAERIEIIYSEKASNFSENKPL